MPRQAFSAVMSSSGTDQDHPNASSKRVFYCSCERYCKGQRTEMTRKSEYNHRKAAKEEKRARLLDLGGEEESEDIEEELETPEQDLVEEQAELAEPVDPSDPRSISKSPSRGFEEFLEDEVETALNSRENSPQPDFDSSFYDPQHTLSPPRSPTPPPLRSESQSDEPEDDPTTIYSDIEDIQLCQKFIEALQDDPSLEKSGMDPKAVEDLLDAGKEPPQFTQKEHGDLLQCLRIFLAQITSSQETYTATMEAIRENHPDDTIYSYDQIKRRVANITGIRPIVHDMCPASCLAYTGPLADHTSCPKCNASRYEADGTSPSQTFVTIPLAPQIQAFKSHPTSAAAMEYFYEEASRRLDELKRDGSIEMIDDFTGGLDVLEAIHEGNIKKNDTVVMSSLDGAQLYRNKASDCWFLIWVVINFSPDKRYKKRYVVPGAIFPGPNKPKIVESFLFPSLYHIAAVNNLRDPTDPTVRGVPLFDAASGRVYRSAIYILLATADGPGMCYMNGLVGHTGKYGCRLWCGMIGRHKERASTYYPMMQKPDDYHVAGCDHGDVDPKSVRQTDQQLYDRNLAKVVASTGPTNYATNRRETGISKPSLFSGLDSASILGVPGMFPGDIMHLILNLGDILLPLWRATLECSAGDSIDDWYWAVLRGAVWEQHGVDIARCTPYLPGSFDRPPRNPAEKINSGYKAWEWLMYLFGLGPGLLFNVLPREIWQSYCKLVAGVRIIYQKRLHRDALARAQKLMCEFMEEFETLYVQRRKERIHFVRQSFHTLRHHSAEAMRIGPGAASSQWTIERMIGDITSETNQHQESKIYKHISQLMVRRAQVNALKAMIPELDRDAAKGNQLPRGSFPLSQGYVLLRKKEEYPSEASALEKTAIMDYFELAENVWNGKVLRWARLRLPNGQIARSRWGENKPLEKTRMARNIKVLHPRSDDGEDDPASLEFAEVLYYFRFDIDAGCTETYAVVAKYGDPHPELLSMSHGTVWSCEPNHSIQVLPISTIRSVVAMVPHSANFMPGDEWKNRFIMVEKPGLDVAVLTDFYEVDHE